MRTNEQLLRNPCPSCDAKAGQQCIGKRGLLRSTCHASRRKGVAQIRVTKPILSTEQDLINAAVMAGAETFMVTSARQIDRLVAMCESPIERVLAAHLLIEKNLWPTIYNIHFMGGFIGEGIPFATYCIPQCPVDQYRVDFLFIEFDGDGLPKTYFVVECDGHDFHERTKDQAARDKRRDRHFAKKGWTVLRYTGSEIWRDPGAVATEVLHTVFGMLGDE